MANHLTPAELADELQMKRQEVIGKCMRDGRPDLPRPHRPDPLRDLAAQPGRQAAGEPQARPDSSLTRLPRDGAGNQFVHPRRPAAAVRASATATPPRSATRKTGSGSTAASTRCWRSPRALARPDRPRRRQGRQGLDPRQHPRPSGPTSTSPRSRPAPSSSRSTRPTRPRSASYVLENSDAKVVVVEDDEQLEKIRSVRDRLPLLEHVVRMTGSSEDAISIERPRRARRRPRRRRVGGALARRSPRTTSAPSSTPRAPPGRRRAASSATATTGRCSTWSTRPA